MNFETLQQALLVSPYHRWLQLKLVSASDSELVIDMPWREEFVSNPHGRVTHGGILAALIDLAGLYAVLAAGGSVSATADLRVDYHRAAAPGTITATSRILKLGTRLSTAEAYLRNSAGQMVASGRGAYLTAVARSATGGGKA